MSVTMIKSHILIFIFDDIYAGTKNHCIFVYGVDLHLDNFYFVSFCQYFISPNNSLIYSIMTLSPTVNMIRLSGPCIMRNCVL